MRQRARPLALAPLAPLALAPLALAPLALSACDEEGIGVSGAPSLRLSADQLIISSPREAGGSAEARLELLNEGGATLIISEVTLTEEDESPEVLITDSDDWTREPVQLAPGAARALTLRWTPTNEQIDSGALTLVTNAGTFVVRYETTDLDPVMQVEALGAPLASDGAGALRLTRGAYGAPQRERVKIKSLGLAPLSVRAVCFVDIDGACLPTGAVAGRGSLSLCARDEGATLDECAPFELGPQRLLLAGEELSFYVRYHPPADLEDSVAARVLIENSGVESPRYLLSVEATPCVGGDECAAPPAGGDVPPAGGDVPPVGGEMPPVGGDEPPELDADGDGQRPSEGDCDDSDPLVYRGAAEVMGDDIDQDCDGADLTPQRTFEVPGEHRVTLPPEVAQVTVRLWGAGGGGGDQLGALGGGGAFVEATFAVSPTDRDLALWVGEGGLALGEGAGGSFVFWAPAVGERELIAVAGGGGGAASDGNSGRSWSGGAGGAGGWLQGQAGQDLGLNQQGQSYSYCSFATGGSGGTQGSGGAGGLKMGTANGCEGAPSTGHAGGSRYSTGVFESFTCVEDPPAEPWRRRRSQGNGGGGAGGSGYFGGGSGGFIWTYCGAGGGGGSSWVSGSALSVAHEAGLGATEGGADRSGGAGRGGARKEPDSPHDSVSHHGAHGRIELSW